jgi:hypothetical protein
MKLPPRQSGHRISNRISNKPETMNTDTPRTNEALAAILDKDGYLSEDNASDVLVKLCRTMERERDEAREALETGGLLGILDRAGHDRAEAIRERDEARKWSATLADAGDEIRAQLREEQQLHAQTLNERDEARERVDTMFAKFVDILEQTRNERDDLAAALNRACANPTTGNWYREAQDALAALKEARK